MHPSPFIETPNERSTGWHRFGRLLRRIINALLLIALALTLLALEAAFTYRMMYDPEALADWGNNLIQSVQAWIAPLSGK